MPDNRFFYYDHDACTFVEVEPSRKGLWLKAGAILCLSLVLSAVGIGVLSTVTTSPAEVAQAEEIDALRGQLASAHSQLTSFFLSMTMKEALESNSKNRHMYEELLDSLVGMALDSRSQELRSRVGGAVFCPVRLRALLWTSLVALWWYARVKSASHASQ